MEISQEFISKLFTDDLFKDKLKKELLGTNIYTPNPKIQPTINQITTILISLIHEAVEKETESLQKDNVEMMKQILSLKNQIQVKSNECCQCQCGSMKNIQLSFINKDKDKGLGDSFLECSEIDINSLKRNVEQMQQKIQQISQNSNIMGEFPIHQQHLNLLAENLENSLNKQQQSFQNKISQLQKQINRRIDHIMKTMRSLFDLINQTQITCPKMKCNLDKKSNGFSNFFGFRK